MAIKWKIDGFYKASAEKCNNELKTLEEITPENTLNYARDNESSELHKCFTWEDDVAAEKWRLKEARQLIQFIVKVDDTPKFKSNSPSTDRVYQVTSKPNVYKPIEYFIEHKDEHQKLLERALGELRSFETRYNNLSELKDVFEAIHTVI